jgi:hypothetical protein
MSIGHWTVDVAISASESGNRIAALKMEDGHEIGGQRSCMSSEDIW